MTIESNNPGDGLDPRLDPDGHAGVGPEFGGAEDEGIVSSVGEHDPMALDAEGVLRGELRKLYDLYGDIVSLLDAGELDEVGRRWYGVVRETLEFQAALGHVIVPEVPDAAGGLPEQARPEAVVQRLQVYDELNPDWTPDGVRESAVKTVEALEAQQRALLPAVQGLAVDLRDRLGEDLRQVMG